MPEVRREVGRGKAGKGSRPEPREHGYGKRNLISSCIINNNIYS